MSRTNLQIAHDPNTAPESLRELTRGASPEVWSAILQNPNTPTDILILYGRHDPAALIKNPVLPLLFLEDALVLHKFPVEVLLRALFSEVSDILLRAYSSHYDAGLLYHAARHPNASIETLEKLSQHADFRPRMGVAENIKCPREILEQLAADTIPQVRSAVAAHPNTPTELVGALSQEPNFVVRQGAATNFTLPVERLRALSKDPESAVLCKVAGNLSVPEDVLFYLAGSGDRGVREAVIKNPNCPPSLVDLYVRAGSTPSLMAFSGATGVLTEGELRSLWGGLSFARALAARHPATSPAQLLSLAQDAETEVKVGVAQNPHAPPEALLLLAKDSQLEVRHRVAQNQSTPPSALSLLSQDTHKEVKLSVAQHPKTPPEALLTLYRDTKTQKALKFEVARHPSAPPDLLLRLARSTETSVRRAVSKNQNLPPAARTLLENDADAIVRNNLKQSEAPLSQK